nr:MAG TPA: hypothetical protein [Caudoviricetes sp.]
MFSVDKYPSKLVVEIDISWSWDASSPVDRKELIYCRLILLTLPKQ